MDGDLAVEFKLRYRVGTEGCHQEQYENGSEEKHIIYSSPTTILIYFFGLQWLSVISA